jgi:hypothetical protein
MATKDTTSSTCMIPTRREYDHIKGKYKTETTLYTRLTESQAFKRMEANSGDLNRTA